MCLKKERKILKCRYGTEYYRMFCKTLFEPAAYCIKKYKQLFLALAVEKKKEREYRKIEYDLWIGKRARFGRISLV